MRTLKRILLATVLALVVAAAGLAIFVYVVSERAFRGTYPAPPVTLAPPDDAEAIARGEHLLRAVGTCTLCHGDDLGGTVYADDAKRQLKELK